jgi:formate dehydrogenase subunit delta
MNIDNLVMMANQIGSFYESMPDRVQALADIASHIRKYWEPRMRRALLDSIQAEGDAIGLLPIVQTSIKENWVLLYPAPRTS